MRVLRLSTNFIPYLRSFYAARPKLAEKTFQAQHRALMEDGFYWTDSWTHALGKCGVKMWEPVFNAEPAQRAWAAENGIRSEATLEEIAIAQAREFKPDVLWVALWDSNADFLTRIKAAVPSLRGIIASVGSAIPAVCIPREVDLVLSCAPETVERLRKDGRRAELLLHAFDPRIVSRLGAGGKQRLVTFAGSFMQGAEFHGERETLLATLARTMPIEIFATNHLPPLTLNMRLRCFAYDAVHGWGSNRVLSSVLNRMPVVKRINQWKTRPESSYVPLWRKIVHPPVWGMEMFRTLRDSKLVLNVHANSSTRYASNLRIFETTGVGACLLTDWRENIQELFEPDREVVTYRNAAEAEEKARYLLENESERQAIARAGQARCFKEHTFDCRSPQLKEIISSLLYEMSSLK